MKAQEMFEALGFKYYHGDEFITIGKTEETDYLFTHRGITFNLLTKIWFAHKNTRFFDGPVDIYHYDFIELKEEVQKAITQQLKELEWNKVEEE